MEICKTSEAAGVKRTACGRLSVLLLESRLLLLSFSCLQTNRVTSSANVIVSTELMNVIFSGWISLRLLLSLICAVSRPSLVRSAVTLLFDALMQTNRLDVQSSETNSLIVSDR